jgi:hypothetical protein
MSENDWKGMYENLRILYNDLLVNFDTLREVHIHVCNQAIKALQQLENIKKRLGKKWVTSISK